jgi:hypothetical protein
LNSRSGTASIFTLATWPSDTFGMSVSSTSISASSTDMSANRQQHGAGVVHRADHGRFALFDVPARDQAVHRRGDDHLAQVVFRGGEARLFLLDLLLARLDLLLARAQVGFARGQLVLGALQRLLGREPVLPQLLLALEVLPGEIEVDVGRFDRGALPREPRLRGGNAGSPRSS